ncbi:MAG: hypothetical protein Q4F66_09765 [Clostridium sp.]|nr:hypothetical protein [Clostridium sp.]
MHKHKKKRKGCTFDMNSISETDLEELTLLYTQLNIVMVLVYSDLMYYFAVISAFNEIVNQGENQKDGFESDRLLIKFSISGLLVYIYITVINIRRYNYLRIRKAAGEVRYSLTPNLFLIIGSILEIAVYSYFYKGSNEFLDRDINRFSFIDNNNIGEVIRLLNIQKNAVILRFYADYLFLTTTIEGIVVVMSRYDHQFEDVDLPNPDISALNCQVLYTISRLIIAQATVKHYMIVADYINRNSKDRAYIAGETSAVYGNYYGIISSVFLLIGFYKIYERNIIQPVFGG